MSKLIVDHTRANRIENIFDWTFNNRECYSIQFKNIDGVIWVTSKTEIYKLLTKTDTELQVIANNQ